ncbi:hypothetical protein [Rosistilla oblonga]|uniref:hypothetical protein n=1 Tax=Rosistilla oblonga TaxID=2527990 RepID=UPI003A9809A4
MIEINTGISGGKKYHQSGEGEAYRKAQLTHVARDGTERWVLWSGAGPTNVGTRSSERESIDWIEAENEAIRLSAQHDAQDLTAYIELYGEALAGKIRSDFKPLHDVERDEVIETDLVRKPFPAQAHVITAAVKAWNAGITPWITADMGTGKTLMGIAAVHTHAKGRPYRAIAMVPPHLPEKWKREIEGTVDGAEVFIVRRYSDLVFMQKMRSKPVGPEWYVISQSTAKLGNPVIPRVQWGRIAGPSRGTRKYQIVKGVEVGRCVRCHGVQFDGRDTRGNKKLLAREKGEKKLLKCHDCHEPMYQQIAKTDRFPVAKYIAKKMPATFDYFVLDEMHESKGASSQIAKSMSQIHVSCKYSVGLTGTLLGGYAQNVMSLLWRLGGARSMVSHGEIYGNEGEFSKRYGRTETKVATTTIGRREQVKTSSKVKPGIMPTLYGKHLISRCITLELHQLSDHLPPYRETTAEGIAMQPDVLQAYTDICDAVAENIGTLMRHPDRSARSAIARLIYASLYYPDHPYGWGEIGYYETALNGNREWRSVITPPDLATEDARPKEEAFVDYLESEVNRGRQCWAFCEMTGTKDVQERLSSLIRERGLTTAILRSKEVPTTKREAWIAENGAKSDIIISNPTLVKTGLELFAPGKHNFSTIAWYQTGYSVYTLRQASRRSWRIGQTEDCEVKFFAYEDSLQNDVIRLIGQKLQTSQAIEGRASGNGLSSLTDTTDSIEVELAKVLAQRRIASLDLAK